MRNVNFDYLFPDGEGSGKLKMGEGWWKYGAGKGLLKKGEVELGFSLFNFSQGLSFLHLEITLPLAKVC